MGERGRERRRERRRREREREGGREGERDGEERRRERERELFVLHWTDEVQQAKTVLLLLHNEHVPL